MSTVLNMNNVEWDVVCSFVLEMFFKLEVSDVKACLL